MKKFKNLFMIMALAILTVLVMPTNVFADTVVTEVRLSTSEIKHGSTISSVATIESTVPAGAINSLDLVWLVSDNSSGTPCNVATGTFEGGKYYAWGYDHIDMNSEYIFQDGVTKYYINGVEYEPQKTFIKVEKVTANITINDSATANRGKFSIANDVNSNKPESTSTLNVDLAKDSTATLYVTPELEYTIEKITVDGNEVSFTKDTSYEGVNKPYKATINMNSDKNIIIYFKDKKILKYDLTAIKKNTDVNKVNKDTNKTELINQKKQDFINKLNEFKTGKTNVTSLSSSEIDALFTENTYAVITNITYKNSTYKASDDLIAIGDLDNWNAMQIAQGSLEKTNNYEVEYTEYTIEDLITYTYKYLSGDNQEFTIKKLDSYTFKIDGDYSKFESLKIGDLTLIKDTDYTVTEGSTIITLTTSGITKLNTLTAGTYNVETKFTDNTVTGKLIIKDEVKQEENKTTEDTNTTEETNTTEDAKTTVENPKTGDGIIFNIVLGSISLIGIAGCGLYINKKKRFN